MTLADEIINSRLTDNAKRAIQGNLAMQVMQPGGQVTYASGAIWWPNLELMQVVPSDGQICNYFQVTPSMQLMQVVPFDG